MVLDRYVSKVTAAVAIVSGMIYVSQVVETMSAPPAPELHWDPRLLLVLCAGLWSAASFALVFTQERVPRRVFSWVLAVTGIGGVASGLLTSGLELVIMAASLLTVFADLSVHMLVLAATTTVLHVFAHAAWESETKAIATALIGVIAGSGGAWLRFEFCEWSRQTHLFDQARWAASEYAQVNATMLDRMDEGVELARLRERARVAREVHDIVGHALTGALVQTRAARKLLHQDPAAADERMDHVEEVINESLQDVRREVSTLRDESAVRCVGSSRWRRLCEAFSLSTGVHVSVRLPYDLEIVPEDVSEAVYRVIQESLTNAYRHGAANHVDVSASWRRDIQAILLRISDNGRGAGALTPGNGLRGMRERVESLKGTLAWQTLPGRGFDIGIEIPWERPEHGKSTNSDR